MNLTLILAWRYLKSYTGNNINSIVRICFFSILMSSSILLLVVSVMQGFKEATYQQLRGLHADLIIEATPNSYLDITKLGEIFSAELPSLLWSPSSSEHVIISNTSTTSFHLNTVVLLKAVDPLKEQETSSLQASLISHTRQLPELIQEKSIVMGQKLAELLEVSVGSHLTLTYNLDSSYTTIDFQQETIEVAGLFKTGIEEFDTQVVYCSLSLMNKLFPEGGITQINIKLPPTANDDQVKQTLKKLFHLPVFSWKDLYPALVSALKLETYALSFIVSLICLMALLNIVSVLFMLIQQKRRDIAILKTMGLNNGHLRKLFLLIGMSITTSACFFGLCLGGLVGILIQKYSLFELPDSYIVKHLPIHLEWSLFFIIFFGVILASLLVTWFTTHKATNIIITDVLRFEG